MKHSVSPNKAHIQIEVVEMTREEFAQKIHWPVIIWLMGLVNVLAMVPQLVNIVQTRIVEGLSLEMFLIYFAVQIALCLEGYFKRSKMLVVCFGLSAIINMVIIIQIITIRYL